MAAYQKGQSVKITGAFVNDVGAAANPTTVTCTVQKPDGTETIYTSITTPAVTNPSTGTFQLILTPTSSGLWVYRWSGTTGTTVAIDEDRFSVLLSEF